MSFAPAQPAQGTFESLPPSPVGLAPIVTSVIQAQPGPGMFEGLHPNTGLPDSNFREVQEFTGLSQGGLRFDQLHLTSSNQAPIEFNNTSLCWRSRYEMSLTQSSFTREHPRVHHCRAYCDLIPSGKVLPLDIHSMLKNETSPDEQRKLVLAINHHTFETYWTKVATKRQSILRHTIVRSKVNTEGQRKQQSRRSQMKDQANRTAFWHAANSTQLYFFDPTCICSHGISCSLEDTMVTLKAGLTIDGEVCSNPAHLASASPLWFHVKA